MFRPFSLGLSGLALLSTLFSTLKPARAATDLLRYNLTLDATACGNTEDVTGADEYYIAGVFTAILPDGSARSYTAATYPFSINDNQQAYYQTVIIDDMLPRGSRIYGKMRFYDEDFGKDWNAVAGKFNAAADAGVKAATATGNATATAVAGAAYAAFKVFDAFSSADKDDLLGQVDVTIGDNTLGEGGVAKIRIIDGKMAYDFNHPAHAGIKAQADAAFANKSLVKYYSGDTTFSHDDALGYSSWAYTQSWLTFIEDPNLDAQTGQPKPTTPPKIRIPKGNPEKQPPAKMKIVEMGKSPYVYQGDFGNKAKLPPKIPGLGTSTGASGGAGAFGVGVVEDDGIAGHLTGGTTGGTTGGVKLPPNDGRVPSTDPDKAADGFKLPGAGGGNGTETGGMGTGGAGTGGAGTGGAGTGGAGTGGAGTETGTGTETGEIGGEDASTVKPVAASKTPVVGKLNQAMAVTLDAKESQDFNLDLPAGQFFVYLDAQVATGNSTDAFLLMLKRNGAEMPGFGSAWIYYNTHDLTSRVGKAFSFAKPTGVRLRIKNDATADASHFWLTVVPASPAKFLPFGFGSKIIAAKIGNNDGTGGPLDAHEFQYLRAVIPAGKWSVSLGSKSDANSYLEVRSYDARGVDYPNSIFITGVGQNERQEKIITLLKPTTLIFRVLNDNTNAATYDLTIEKSTD